MEMEILRTSNLSKTFTQGHEKLQVIKPTNIKFYEGTINIIMGESGSGKTTLLNLLAGIEQPTDGSVYYRGVDFYKSSEKKQARIRGKNYGIVFQFFNLIPELNVEENIKLPSIINHQSVDMKYYKELLEILNLQKLLLKGITTLSGGEQQRVAIARAMLLKPSILFADEPTGNLDRRNSDIIVDVFKEINTNFDTTLIIVTHDTGLFSNPDQKILMNDGYLLQR